MIKVFFSYSHKDEILRNTLETHLCMLRRQSIITTWHDRRIGAGNDFAKTIDENLLDSDVILLLISPDFLASDYCHDVEMTKALERHNQGKAKVIPVILRPCEWKEAQFSNLLALPKDGKPVSKFSDIDEAFLEITTGIREAVSSLGKKIEIVVPEKKFTQQTPVLDAPRSSNLRVRKSFTDHDKIIFFTDAFEYIAQFFEQSLIELQKRNPDISTRFRRIDANQFNANLFKHGSEVNKCRIWFSEAGGFGRCIAYSAGQTADSINSMNEMLSIYENEQSLFLHASMGSFNRTGKGENMNFLGAAEYYWANFIEPLQR